jgi:hypothetical protein
MAPAVAQGVLWLFVMNLGLDFGAGLYEYRIQFPQWLVQSSDGSDDAVWDAQAAIRSDVGRRFWAFVSTGPLTLLSLASAFMAPRVGQPASQWWMIGATLTIAERLFTFTYFIPTMISLTGPGVVSDAQVVAKATRWGKMNRIRLALTMASWLAAMQALANFQRSEGIHA